MTVAQQCSNSLAADTAMNDDEYDTGNMTTPDEGRGSCCYTTGPSTDSARRGTRRVLVPEPCMPCIVCEHETSFRGASHDLSHDNLSSIQPVVLPRSSAVRINKPQRASTDAPSAPDRLALYRLGICEMSREPQMPIPTSLHSINPTRSTPKLWFDILNSLDLSASSVSISCFNLDAFASFFIFSGFTHEIEPIVKKILNDIGDYNKNDKGRFLYVLIFVYLYLKNSRQNLIKCRDKIETFSHLFKPLYEFEMQLQDDKFIDKFIVQMRTIRADYGESLFLNKLYLRLGADKTLFPAFHYRLTTSLSVLSASHLFSFLRYVFLYSTVLFSCITEMQLYSLVLSFYKSNAKAEQVASLIEQLFEKAGDPELNNLLIEKFREISLKTTKYKMLCHRMDVLTFTRIPSYGEYLRTNSDSFLAVSTAFKELESLCSRFRSLENSTGTSDNVNSHFRMLPTVCTDTVRLELLEAVVCLFTTVKLEFFRQLLKPWYSLMGTLMEGVRVYDSAFAVFNNEHWPSLSNAILLTQRIIAQEDGGVKKPKKKTAPAKMSELAKSLSKLVKTICDIEHKARSAGLTSIIPLKKKGFRMD